METVPIDYEKHHEAVCSNFDHVINQEVVEHLKTHNAWSSYPGWNFHGSVWFDQDRGKFLCQIMQYHAHTATVEADTFEELKEEICARFGNA
jgi:hypothetical protein